MTEKEIWDEYHRLQYTDGWSFMYSPAARLSDATVAFIGLNPGGKDEDIGRWDHPSGNAYEKERWAADEQYNRLQLQIAALFKILDVPQDEVFAAQFVPFRSVSWKSLPHKGQALSFGRKLWSWVLEESSAKLLVCLGNTVTQEIVGLTDAKLERQFETGWGKQTFDRYISSEHVVVRVPHLSRYAVFNRTNIKNDNVMNAFRSVSL